MVFAVPSDPQPSRFYRGKAQSNRLAQCCGVDVRNSVLVTDSTVGEVETLSWNVPVWIGSVVGGEPKQEKK